MINQHTVRIFVLLGAIFAILASIFAIYECHQSMALIKLQLQEHLEKRAQKEQNGNM